MNLDRKTKILVGGVALLSTAGAGAAVASSQASSPRSESKAVLDAAAKQLGIPSSKLSGALKKALTDRADAALAAGRITKAEADAIKQHIESSDFPLLGGLRHGFGHRDGFDHLEAAAGYIGITEAQIRTELEGGKTLAQVARDQGKSAAGLVDALLADAKQKLDDAVSAGRLTKPREAELLDGLKDRITKRITETDLDGPHFERPRFGFHHFDGSS